MRFIFAICCLMMLSACSMRPPALPSEANISGQFQPWQAIGKLLIFTPDRRQSVNFRWTQTAQGTQLRLFTSLGISILDLTQQQGITRIDYDGKRYQSDDATQLIYQLTGWQIPVTKLPQWIYRVNAHDFTYTDWYITYQSTNGQLPEQITLRKDTYRLVLNVKEWR